MAFTLFGRCHRLATLALMAPLALAAADDPVDRVEKVANDWVRTRAETVRAETEWSGQRALLESLVGALDERARLVAEKAEHAKAQTAQEREELGTLAGKNQVAAAGLQAAEARLRELTRGLLELRPLLPPRLSAALDLPYRSLADASLGVADRMQHTLTVLNRCVQFNRAITCNEEVLTLEPGAAPRSLEVIYWGLSHGYALDRAAGRVWRGAPGPQGWRWTAEPGSAAEVARLIAIATDRADPEFVVVPATLQPPTR